MENKKRQSNDECIRVSVDIEAFVDDVARLIEPLNKIGAEAYLDNWLYNYGENYLSDDVYVKVSTTKNVAKKAGEKTFIIEAIDRSSLRRVTMVVASTATRPYGLKILKISDSATETAYIEPKYSNKKLVIRGVARGKKRTTPDDVIEKAKCR